MGRSRIFNVLVIAFGLLLVTGEVAAVDYNGALNLALMYFEAQRSGPLPASQRVTWRGDSGMTDGSDQGVDLVGGYYDAGDNVKYGFPGAFAMTILSWSVIEYSEQLQTAGQLDYALEAIKWGTDYFIKAHTAPNVLWGEVGDGNTDHACWMKPEDMTTSRQAYKIDAENPGSDLAGETAAAMAAASIVFAKSDPTYSATLLSHSRQLFTFADTYRGAYSNSIPIVQAFYNSWSGYDDELLWAAVWLYDATGEASYLQYLVNNANTLGGTGWAMDQFSWDNKYVGVQIKATKILLDGRGGSYTSTLQQYQVKAEYFLCAAMQVNFGKNIFKSPGGMFWIQSWNNMQYVTTTTFVLTVASDYYSEAHVTPQHCSSSVTTAEMLSTAQGQTNYILGLNSRGTSYLIGFTENYPQQVHHRGASIAAPVGCSQGFSLYYYASTPNPHVLQGGISGGPDQNDNFQDVRSNYAMAEACIYNTSPMVGVLARLSVGQIVTRTYTAPTTNNNNLLSGQSTPSPPTHQIRQTRAPAKPTTKPTTPIVITQKLVDQWVLDGKTRYFKYDVTIKNTGTKPIDTLRVVVHKLYGDLWGLVMEGKNGNIYGLPSNIVTLEPGEVAFVTYIHPYGEAEIYVRSYTLV